MHWLLGLTFLHVFGEGGSPSSRRFGPGSLALLAFGLESVIEGGAAFLAVRHLRHLADEEEDHAHRDQVLARWIGVSFLLLAAYTLVARHPRARSGRARPSRASSGSSSRSSRRSACRSSGTSSGRPAAASGSKGLAAEAKESIACSIDSALTLLAMIAGLLARAAAGSIRPCRC